MELVTALAKLMGQVLVDTFTSPFFVALFGMMVLLVFWQNYRQYKQSLHFFPDLPNVTFKSAGYSSLLGMLGGIAGSVLLVMLGINLDNISITALWITALLLMLIQPRFICFAYAAGVIAVANLLFGFPRASIPQLMGLVAVLHMIESLLILLNGSYHPSAVYIKRHERFCGGFNMQFFWPIPLLALISASHPGAAAAGLTMPTWWPLLQDYSGLTASREVFTIVPAMAVLGYGEICTTRTPRQASRRSALRLFIYALLLLTMAVLSSRIPAFLVLVALFSPLGHELVIWLGMRDESRPPFYVAPERGVMIMEVVGDSARRAGLQPGDVILQIDGEEINSVEDLRDLLAGTRRRLNLCITRSGRTLNLIWPSNPTKGRFFCWISTNPTSPTRGRFSRISGLNLRKSRSDRSLNPSGYNRAQEIIPVPGPETNAYLVWQEDKYFNMARRAWKKLKSM
ncbi:MAG TPA: PDZ domain-containing protein [Syntrophomonas sp.]|nr:PDZ domain-containing protein [Syntrophomonas sp.]